MTRHVGRLKLGSKLAQLYVSDRSANKRTTSSNWGSVIKYEDHEITPLKPQHSNPNSNPNHLANQLWRIDFLTPPTPFIIPHRLRVFLESLIPLKNWCLIRARWSKSSLKHSIHFCGIFPSLKHNFIAYRSSKVSDCIFEIHQLWQSGFSRVYSSCCCSCSFEPEIIKIGQSSHKLYSNKILNLQESTTILNAYTKKVWKLIECIT